MWKKIMKISVILLIAAILSALSGTDRAAYAAESGSTPVIALNYVPAYGVNSPITGVVFREDGSSYQASDYRISVFLQIEEGQQYWRKPYDDRPYTDLGSDGSFSALFNTGGNDVNAKILHIMLIPSDYTPVTFSDTKSRALDYVRVTRTEDGDVTVTPAREAPVPTDVQPAISAFLPVSEERIAVDVGFYTDGSQPGSALSEELIRKQLTAVSEYADTVRFYGSGGELAKAYPIAHEMGFKIAGTAYLCGNEKEDKAEMDALIEHCNKGYVQVAIVGNETLLETQDIRPKLTAAELIADIRYVRENLTDNTIPVTTSDSVDVLLANSAVRNACNLIMPNCYPYWGGTGIDDAANTFIDQMNALKAVSGEKQVLVSETGWPTAGQTIGSAVAGEEQAAQYFDRIREWSLEWDTQVLFFDAADEPWKGGSGGEGEAGAHWGFMTTDFALKDGYKETEFFQKKSAQVSLKSAVVTGVSDAVYAGKAVTPKPVVKLGGKTLSEGTDYTVSYMDNTKVGTAVAVISGIGSYKGMPAETFSIFPGSSGKVTAANVASGIKVSWQKVEGATSYYVYRGSKKLFRTSALVVTDKEVKYSGGKKYVYKVIATAKGVGDSPKSRTATMYRLMPVGIKSLTNPSAGKMKVTYDESSGSSGYVVRFGLKKDMSDAKVITVKGAATTSRTFSGMKKGKTYYVQVRTYKIENGVRYYSGYCTTKKITITK